jgi:TPR repeat protein
VGHLFFISYASEDRLHAQAVCALLESCGTTYWIAPDSIGLGESFTRAISQAIRESVVVLLVFSRASDASKHVMREIELAHKHQKTVVPVRVEDHEPDNLEYQLGVSQWVDFYGERQPDGERKLKRFVAGLSASPVSTAPTDQKGASQVAAKQRAGRSHGAGLQDWLHGRTHEPPREGSHVSVEQLQKAAAAGDLDAMNSLGCRYVNGEGVIGDLRRARQWFEKAAAAGDLTAMNHLGLLYRSRVANKRNMQLSLKWYKKAATAGDSTAMFNLGLLYQSEPYVKRDRELARQWYERAVAAGDIFAMVNLGSMFEREDSKLSWQWYEKGAAAGDEAAMYRIGAMYDEGVGVRKNHRLALQWYEKAAAAGSIQAIMELARLYEGGEWLKQDYRLARHWYRKAAAAGNSIAKARLKELQRIDKARRSQSQ